MSTPVVEVRIWDILVGAVAPDPRLGTHVFEYDAAWIRRGIELAPLQMPITSGNRKFAFPSLASSFKGLPGLLADALPDDFGNALIDAWMATKGRTQDSVTTLDRLAYMGRRGMGALEFRPPLPGTAPSAEPLEMQALVESARSLVRGDFTNDVHAQAALANIIQVGTSAGGARAKAVIAFNPKTQEIRSGQFDAPPGFEHWLLKFDGVGEDRELGTSADYGRIEHAYFEMATAAGVEMSPCRLLHESGRAHFMTQRFDCRDNARHHVQSLCAMGHLDYKQRGTHAYEQLFRVAVDLGLGAASLTQLFRRMAFNVAARNCDDHTKNFGFLLEQGGVWRLTPAYDVTHAHNPSGEWTRQHLMSVNGKFERIDRVDLLRVAERFSVPYAEAAFVAVNAAIDLWPDFAQRAGVSERERLRVAADHRHIS